MKIVAVSARFTWAKRTFVIGMAVPPAKRVDQIGLCLALICVFSRSIRRSGAFSAGWLVNKHRFRGEAGPTWVLQRG
jgi:hypothetical protein